jgi:glycosyltransferase involved in cell wall biosynthesis
MTVPDYEPLRDKDIVCLATQEWDAHWTPVQQVMLRLAPLNRILYIEPFHVALGALRKGNAVFQQQLRQGVPQLREVQENLHVYRPSYPYVPWNMKSKLASKINSWLFARELSRLMRKLEFRQPWLWAFFAQSLSVLDLPFERVVYDCVDDWPSFFPDVRERERVTQMDERMTQRADIVFVGSDPLKTKKVHQNQSLYVVNHAADIPHFLKAADESTCVPADLDRIPHPRIGFVGMMDALRFDSELIRAVSDNPSFQVVIIGGIVGKDQNLIPSRPNVHFLGMKSVDELPSYLKGIDVCMMPYRVNETTTFIFPLKLFEYLATGKPVVSMAIPAVSKLGNYVYVADSQEEFVQSITAALSEVGDEPSRKRMAFARLHGWDSHVKRKTELIFEHFPELTNRN